MIHDTGHRDLVMVKVKGLIVVSDLMAIDLMLIVSV